MWVFEGLYDMERAGLIPAIIYDADPRPAKEQIEDRYSHGGGWQPLSGWNFNQETFALSYPDEDREELKTMFPIGLLKRKEEIVLLYESAFVVVAERPELKNFTVIRMD